jgi:hypothetical protein
MKMNVKKDIACVGCAALIGLNSCLTVPAPAIRGQVQSLRTFEVVNEPVHVHTDAEPDQVQETTVAVATQSTQAQTWAAPIGAAGRTPLQP